MTPQPHSTLAGLSRRRMLGLMLGLSAALLAGCSLGDRKARGPAGGTSRCLSFDADQAATLEALIAAVVPTMAPFPAAADARVLDRFDEETYFVSAEVREDIRTAIDALEYLPFLYGHFGRFSRLPLGARRRVLGTAMQSRFAVPRAVAGSLRMMAHLFYYGHPTTWPATGYDGPFARIAPILGEQRVHFAELRDGAQR
jgi:hypothetical protein